MFVSGSYEFPEILLFMLDSAQNCSQRDKTQEPALRTVSGFLKHGGLLPFCRDKEVSVLG